MLIIAMPFDLSKVIHRFVDTVSSYPYASVNGFNFWTFIGRNKVNQANKFLFMPASSWGSLAIVCMVVSTFILLNRAGKAKKDDSKYFISAAFLIAGVFVFSVRMHERYLFPVVALLLFAFVMNPVKEVMYAYIGFSTVHFLNVGYVLCIDGKIKFSPKAVAPILISAATIAMFFYFLYVIKKWYEDAFGKGTG